MRGFLGMALLVCWGTAAAAQPADCSKAADQTSMNLCSEKRYAAADKALNEAYKGLTARVDPDGKAALDKAESRWVAFRDAQCDFETMGSRGGSVHPFVRNLCLTDLTEGQTRRLNAQLHCEEGDVSCGGQ